MDALTQAYGSRKYIGHKLTILPHEGGFLVGHGYEPSRSFIGYFTPAELLAYLCGLEPLPAARYVTPVREGKAALDALF